MSTKQGAATETLLYEKRNWLIHMHYVRKDYDTCRALISEQLKEHSYGVNEYANFVKGLMLRSQGRVQESLEAFQQCVLLNSGSISNLKELARSLFLLGRHRAALEIYGEGLKLNANDYEVHHNMALCYFHLGDFNQAKDRLKQALALQRNERSLRLLAKIMQQEGEIAGAVDALKRSLECSPENCEVLTLLGNLYMDAGQYGKAFEYYGSALSFDPTYADAILGAASMMQQNADYDVALTKYRVVAERQPESPAVWNNIGLCFLGKRKFVAALSCLKRANYLAPLDWKTLYNLGLLYLNMQQYASAFQYISAAINHRPKMARLYMMLAVALTHLEDTENARLAYEEALKIDQREPLISLNYAVFLYKAKSDAQGAAKSYADFERKVNQLKASGVTDFDPEMFDVANALGAAIHVGDRTMWSQTVKPTTREQVKPEPTIATGNASKLIERSSPISFAHDDDKRATPDDLADKNADPTASASASASASTSRMVPRAATLLETDKDDGHSAWSAVDFGKHVIDNGGSEKDPEDNWTDDGGQVSEELI